MDIHSDGVHDYTKSKLRGPSPHCNAGEEENPLQLLVVEEVVEGPQGPLLLVGKVSIVAAPGERGYTTSVSCAVGTLSTA